MFSHVGTPGYNLDITPNNVKFYKGLIETTVSDLCTQVKTFI